MQYWDQAQPAWRIDPLFEWGAILPPGKGNDQNGSTEPDEPPRLQVVCPWHPIGSAEDSMVFQRYVENFPFSR